MPSGFAALWILGMQDNSASQADIFGLKLFILVHFLIGGIIGSLSTFLQTNLKQSAILGAVVISIVIFGIYLYESKKNEAAMVIVYLFYILPGIIAGATCGFLNKKTIDVKTQ